MLYQVERSRDGKSFTTRRVLAIQKGEQIFNMACSFQVAEDGYEHQTKCRALRVPKICPTISTASAKQLKDVPQTHNTLAAPPAHRDASDRSGRCAQRPSLAGAEQMVWIRARGDVGDDIALNQALLAYASDYSLLGTAMRPHGVSWMSGVQTASLDHILWFHRPTNFSRWHLYVQDSPQRLRRARLQPAAPSIARTACWSRQRHRKA